MKRKREGKMEKGVKRGRSPSLPSSDPSLLSSFLVGQSANDLSDYGSRETRFNNSSGHDWMHTTCICKSEGAVGKLLSWSLIVDYSHQSAATERKLSSGLGQSTADSHTSVGTVSHRNECKACVQTFTHNRRTAAPPHSWRRQQRTSHFHFPSSSTVVMVSLTSVSPLLYASPNISHQAASLINTHQTSRTHRLHPPSPDARCIHW
ncbi:hypothetical protein F2P81_012949 [Scophthalmus maximus]|uniref:Uncharacterized protein n=1 Tax=Scophthalmus maximus TaxID=52904 RepID=A0A6A4SVV6_SCOMX|nr:hypothetical protein F2P81_012949 [Scophthalmus maximus]